MRHVDSPAFVNHLKTWQKHPTKAVYLVSNYYEPWDGKFHVYLAAVANSFGFKVETEDLAIEFINRFQKVYDEANKLHKLASSSKDDRSK